VFQYTSLSVEQCQRQHYSRLALPPLPCLCKYVGQQQRNNALLSTIWNRNRSRNTPHTNPPAPQQTHTRTHTDAYPNGKLKTKCEANNNNGNNSEKKRITNSEYGK